MSYTGSVPETPRKPDWRNKGACRTQDPELFFLTGSAAENDAKTVCRSCPVTNQCLQHAIDNGIDYGTWGGLTEKERRALRRRKTAKITPEDIEEVRRPATLEGAWQARTRQLDGGHLGWSGPKALYFQGITYTPNQAAFIITRGTRPYGQVLAVCGAEACIRPEHLADARERAERMLPPQKRSPLPIAECGTRSAYQRHVRNGEVVDEACRNANLTKAQEYRHAKKTAA